MHRFRRFTPPTREFEPLSAAWTEDGDFEPGLPVRRLDSSCQTDIIVGDRSFRVWPVSGKASGESGSDTPVT
ncbi:MAG: hypothetical protein Kow00100_15760 [Geothermobacteraceae bacterium]